MQNSYSMKKIFSKSSSNSLKFPTVKNLNEINFLDSIAVYHYNKRRNNMSNIFQVGLMTVPFIFLIDNKVNKITTLSVMYLEAFFLSHSLARYAKNSIIRYRPYSYFMEPTDSIPTNPQNSFISGHSTTAFVNASFITTVFSNMYPYSPMKYIVGIGTFSLAATVGILRITSGNHFISDVIAGAFVGSLFGWLIPHMHKDHSKKRLQLRLFQDKENNLGVNFIINLN